MMSTEACVVCINSDRPTAHSWKRVFVWDIDRKQSRHQYGIRPSLCSSNVAQNETNQHFDGKLIQNDTAPTKQQLAIEGIVQRKLGV